MSSDSGDLDEDELLQMALQEQSRRDVNYQQPSSKPSRPVSNFVQPPPQRATNQRVSAPPKSHNTNARPAQRAQQRRGSMDDDDDDSEVEMLSISSGDEESSKGRGSESRNRAGSGGRRAGKEDDGDWDGGEPHSWKRVDEAEVRI